MAKKGSWYFEGYEAHYEIDEQGRKKKVLTYVGQRYGLRNREDLFRVRVMAAVDVVLMTVILLLINFFPGTGGMVGWVGAPCLWGLIPLRPRGAVRHPGSGGLRSLVRGPFGNEEKIPRHRGGGAGHSVRMPKKPLPFSMA